MNHVLAQTQVNGQLNALSTQYQNLVFQVNHQQVNSVKIAELEQNLQKLRSDQASA